ncbi:MAG: hypothetical protein WC364_00460 [Eubacteriales bacterium]|jgi:fucose 4-O-acetylase-like acetyltransferase
MKEARDNSLDVAKGIGILLVVIGHLQDSGAKPAAHSRFLEKTL